MVMTNLLFAFAIGAAHAGETAANPPAPVTPSPPEPTPAPAPPDLPLAIPVDPDDVDPAIPPAPTPNEVPDATIPPIDVIEPIEPRERTFTGFQWGTFAVAQPSAPAVMYDGGFRMWLDRDHRILEIGATVGFSPTSGDAALALDGEFGINYAFRPNGSTGFIGGGGGFAGMLVHGDAVLAAVPYAQAGVMTRHRGRVSVWGGRVDAPVQLGGWEGHYVPYARLGLFWGMGW